MPANIRTDAKRGRLDKAVTCLLSSYPIFLMLGPVIVVLLLMHYGLMALDGRTAFACFAKPLYAQSNAK